MSLRFVAGVAVLLSASFGAQAQESESVAGDAGPWSGKAALGFLATSGNSESSNLNAALELGYATGNWRHLLEASAISAREEDMATAEAYMVGFRSEYSFTEHNFLFGRVIWRKDLFSGYDQQFSQTVGYGRRIIDTEAHQLSADIGVGARQSELRDGTSESDVIARAGLNYRWQFSENAQFTQDLTVESGEVNTYLESVTAVNASLMGELSLVASYTIKNNSEVPAATEKTDTYTAVALEYAF